MVKPLPVQEAYEDLLQRSLSRIPCDLGVCSTSPPRGLQHGKLSPRRLADRFSVKVARSALEIAHRQAFLQGCRSFAGRTGCDLASYLESSRENPEEFLRTWQRLEPYRIAIPMEVNPTVARLFASNVRLALAVLRLRQESTHADR